MAPLQTKIKNWIVTRKETVTDAHSFIFLKECGVQMLYICCPTGIQGIIGFMTTCVKDYIGAKLLPRNEEYKKKKITTKT